VIIRDAAEREIDEIAELLLDSYREYAPPDGDPLRPSFDRYFDEIADVKSRWATSQHIVAADTDTLAGCVTFFADGSLAEPAEDRWPEGYAALRLLAVSPAARGKGIGRALTEECIARARAAGRAWIGLHTTKLMTIAREMYERMGFTRFPDNDIPVAPGFVVVAYRLPLS
jgi:ribosomal protein S18 acetylase RimI-like enzyme